MNRTKYQDILKEISEHQEYLDNHVENLDFRKRSPGDRAVHLALSELSCIVAYQTEIIKGLVEAISISPQEQNYKIKIKDCSMSPRLQTVLYNLGFEYIDEAYDLWIREGDWGLLKVHYNFGRKSLNELKDIFGELDWHMPQQETKNNE